jgi:hypothetical protein
MAELIAARYPDRRVHVVGDAAYVGEHRRGLPAQVSWTSRLKVTSVLHELAPPRTGRSGRPRTPNWSVCGMGRFTIAVSVLFWFAMINLVPITAMTVVTGLPW